MAERRSAKPFTQEQVVSMVRDGFGDESGAKLIEQRGIGFAPSEDFLQTLKAAGHRWGVPHRPKGGHGLIVCASLTRPGVVYWECRSDTNASNRKPTK